MLNPTQRRISDETKQMIDKFLLKRISLPGIVRVTNDWCDLLLADPTFFTVSDRFPIERLVPIRHDHSPHYLGNKGRDNGRWRVGITVWWLVNDGCRVVAWD